MKRDKSIKSLSRRRKSLKKSKRKHGSKSLRRLRGRLKRLKCDLKKGY
jgi:hypothetical protein